MLNGLSWLYGKIMSSRNSLYSRQLLKSREMPAVTISVGNITVGGTGKTPLIKFLAEYLSKKGEEVCIISRGYKRRDESKRVLVSNKKIIVATLEEAGDEPFELANGLIGKCIVIADRDRVGAADWAARNFGISVFLLDDAFQHRKAARDLDIVLLDATNPFGNMRTLPAGILREPAAGIERADIAVVTRSDLATDIDQLVTQIENLAPGLPVFKCSNKIEGFRALGDTAGQSDRKAIPVSRPAFAFCGIGNSTNFFEHLIRNDLTVVGFKAFDDHHTYTKSDLNLLHKECMKAGADLLLTTTKDAVKLESQDFSIPCFICENSLNFEDGQGFLNVIDLSLTPKKSNGS